MGESFMLNREVNQVIGTRLALSVTLSLSHPGAGVPDRHPHRHLLRHPPALRRRLLRYRVRLPGAGHAELFAGADPDVPHLHPLRLGSRWVVLPGVHRGGVEFRQGHRPDQAPARPADRDRHRRHRRDHPYPARNAVGRVGQAVRDHRPHQGGGRGAAFDQVPGPHGAQPHHQHHRWAASPRSFPELR